MWSCPPSLVTVDRQSRSILIVCDMCNKTNGQGGMSKNKAIRKELPKEARFKLRPEGKSVDGSGDGVAGRGGSTWKCP